MTISIVGFPFGVIFIVSLISISLGKLRRTVVNSGSVVFSAGVKCPLLLASSVKIMSFISIAVIGGSGVVGTTSSSNSEAAEPGPFSGVLKTYAGVGI